MQVLIQANGIDQKENVLNVLAILKMNGITVKATSDTNLMAILNVNQLAVLIVSVMKRNLEQLFLMIAGMHGKINLK